MDPVIDDLEKALKGKLKRGENAAAYITSLATAVEVLVHLDMGMVGGLALKKERKDALTEEALGFARRCFDKAVALDARKTVRWIASVPIYAKPKTIDFAAWEEIARSFKSTPPAVPRIDLDAHDVPKALAVVLRRLLAAARANPKLHRLNGPASDDAIREREEEIGAKLPRDVRILYRVSDGFSLFCGHQPADVDASPFRLVALHDLQPYAWTLGEEVDAEDDDGDGLSLDEAIADPARLQVFDVGNGDFVSCTTHRGRTLWIDDYSDGPERVLARSLHLLLEYVLSEERTADGKRPWTHEAWKSLGDD